jgi:hypothetical protein
VAGGGALIVAGGLVLSCWPHATSAARIGTPQAFSALARTCRRSCEASHARVRETLLAKRVLLKALATLLIQHEVVDRNALDGLLATPVSEEAASALVPG